MSALDEILAMMREFRSKVERAAQSIPDEEAEELADLFPEWTAKAYAKDARVRYDGHIYRCIQAHSENATWTPTAAPSLWTKVLTDETGGTVLPWEQPESTNPYKKGDRVTHNGKTWESTCNGNVWAPGVYGWSVVA